MVQCVALNCRNRPENTSGVSFFTFPKDKTRRKLWLIKLKRSHYTPRKNDRVCGVHFEQTCYRVKKNDSAKRQRLAKDAVPTIFVYRVGDEEKKTNCPKKTSGAYEKRQRARVVEETKQCLTAPSQPAGRPTMENAVPSLTPAHILTQVPSKPTVLGLTPIRSPPPACSLMPMHSPPPASSPPPVCSPLPACSLTAMRSLLPVFKLTPVHNPTSVSSVALTPCVQDQAQVSSKLLQEPFKYSPTCSPNTLFQKPTMVQSFTQTSGSRKSVKTQCSPIVHDKGVQTPKEQMKTVDVGIQCLLLDSPKTLEADDDSDEDDGDVMITDDDCVDPDWTPSDGDDDQEEDEEEFELAEEENPTPASERKFIVFESCLRTLFAICLVCGSDCSVVLKQTMGTMVSVMSVCSRWPEHRFEWKSQPTHRRMPVGNLLVAAATLFSGCSPAKMFNFFRHLNLLGYARRTYFNIQQSYLIPAVSELWSREQARLIEERKGQQLRLGGDARFCSPGHTAKYGNYTLMDLTSGDVLTTQLIQSSEVKNSSAMELEGLKRGMTYLETQDVTITDLTTDRHVQVRKWLRTEKPTIHHWFDIWHVSKSVFRKLEAVSKKAKCAAVGEWARSISNHMYWAAASSNGDGDLVEEKWTSVARHVVNIHEDHGQKFQRCEHEEITRAWIEKGSRAHKEVENIVCSTRLKKDVRQLSPADQTACLESFHSLVCFFATKQTHFFYESMEARVILAVLHFNENSNRQQARKSDGSLQWQLSYPKYKKGGVVVRPVKEVMTYKYADDLMRTVWCLREGNPSYKDANRITIQRRTEVPKPVVCRVNKVPKHEAVAAHRSRFARASTSTEH